MAFLKSLVLFWIMGMHGEAFKVYTTNGTAEASVSEAERRKLFMWNGLFYGAFITLVLYSWRYCKCDASYG
jgi:hypothetical protein